MLSLLIIHDNWALQREAGVHQNSTIVNFSVYYHSLLFKSKIRYDLQIHDLEKSTMFQKIYKTINQKVTVPGL